MKQRVLKILYRFLALCARIYISRHRIQMIAITGSVGKTSCRMVVTEVLQQLQKEASFPLQGREFKRELIIYTSPKNYNSELGLIFSLFQIEDYHPSTKNLLKLSGYIFLKAILGKKNTDILVAEYGIDSPKDMEHLLRVALPDITVLTKLDTVHSANFPRGVEQYWQEKWKLLLAAKVKVYLNIQDEFSKQHLPLLKNYVEIFGNIGIFPELRKDTHNIARWHFRYKGKMISHNLLGEENNHYVALGFDIANDLGIQLFQDEYHFQLENQPGRFSLFPYLEHILIDSSYNAAPESVKQVLKNVDFLHRELFSEYKKIAVLGDMRELEYPEEAHCSLARELGDFDALYTVGPNMYEYMIPKLKEHGFSGIIISSLSSRDIGQKLKLFLEKAAQNYIVIFKGSQNTIFTEEALAVLLSPEDQKKLPRQSEAWKVKKREFFRGV